MGVVWLMWFDHSSNSGRLLLMLLAVIGVGIAVWRRCGDKGCGAALVRGWWHRRLWRENAGPLGLAGPDGQAGRVVSVVGDEWGTTSTYRLWPGQGPAAFEARAVELAHAMGVLTARVSSPGPGLVMVRYLTGDPLGAVSLRPWPLMSVARWQLGDAVPSGVGEDGRVVTVALWSSSVLLAGSPGSGKSATMWLLVLAAMLDPSVRLMAVDLKGGVELGLVASRAERLATTLDDAVAVIDDALVEVSGRYGVLRERGLRKVESGDPSMPPLVVVIDELAELTGTGSKESKAAGESLRRLVATGRAAGVTVIAATQKPSSDVVPTGLRDLFATRIGLRCGMRGQAETIAPEIAGELTKIPASQPGTAYVVDEGGSWQRFRAWYLTDDMVRQVASAAEAARS
ncbi:MAG: hypothetical protein DLM54_10470 [Acidimicrobiales bacterium]|nr:MAG: hypothetical protein DLM54_10470 [Acidimicrobiales bacterium]